MTFSESEPSYRILSNRRSLHFFSKMSVTAAEFSTLNPTRHHLPRNLATKILYRRAACVGGAPDAEVSCSVDAIFACQ